MSNYIAPKDFEPVLKEMLNEIPAELKVQMPKAARKAAREGKKSVLENIKKAGIETHPLKSAHGHNYVDGWSYTVKQTSEGVDAEIGNKYTPGLVHLLEKGHAKVGGGRVQAYEHVDPAATDAFAKFDEELKRIIESL